MPKWWLVNLKVKSAFRMFHEWHDLNHEAIVINGNQPSPLTHASPFLDLLFLFVIWSQVLPTFFLILRLISLVTTLLSAFLKTNKQECRCQLDLMGKYVPTKSESGNPFFKEQIQISTPESPKKSKIIRHRYLYRKLTQIRYFLIR